MKIYIAYQHNISLVEGLLHVRLPYSVSIKQPLPINLPISRCRRCVPMLQKYSYEETIGGIELTTLLMILGKWLHGQVKCDISR